MKRSRLRNKFLKNKNEINRNNYKVPRNYCKKLLKTTKKQYFHNLNTSKVTENRTFWKTVVHLFSITTITKQRLSSSFNFQKTNANEVMRIISQLNAAKTCQFQIFLLKSLNLIKIFLQNLSVITSTTVLMKVNFHMN